MTQLTTLSISYPDFKLNEVIDPDQFDINNKDIVDKINQILAQVNTNTTNIIAKADRTYVDTQDANLQSQINTNRTDYNAKIDALTVRVAGNETRVTALETTRATIKYVDDKIALIQSGYIAENSVTTSKLVDGAVTRAKIANQAIDSSKIDGVTVYTATQVDTRISSSAQVVITNLQPQIDTNKTNINALCSRIDLVNTRIDNLEYNKDLYSAKQDIIVLAINMEVLKGSQISGISENMVIETLVDVSDLDIVAGVYQSANKRIILP